MAAASVRSELRGRSPGRLDCGPYVDNPYGRHPPDQRSDGKSSRNRCADRRYAATYEHFGPRDAGRRESLRRSPP
jgi:hypothetical protein